MAGHTPLLVLDLDGTLADTALDLVPALNRTVATLGLPPVHRDELGHLVGHGVRPMIERALALHGHHVPPHAVDGLVARYFDDYGASYAANTTLFEGALEALDELAGEGWRLAICTNKPIRFAEPLLVALGVRERFAAVTGGDSFPFRKPDARHLFGTVEAAGCEAARTIFVGDSRTDVDTARNAGIPVIGVTFGYTDVPMADLGADRVIDAFAALPGMARQLDGELERAAPRLLDPDHAPVR